MDLPGARVALRNDEEIASLETQRLCALCTWIERHLASQDEAYATLRILDAIGGDTSGPAEAPSTARRTRVRGAPSKSSDFSLPSSPILGSGSLGSGMGKRPRGEEGREDGVRWQVDRAEAANDWAERVEGRELEGKQR